MFTIFQGSARRISVVSVCRRRLGGGHLRFGALSFCASLAFAGRASAIPPVVDETVYGNESVVRIDLNDAHIPPQRDPWSCCANGTGRMLAHAGSPALQTPAGYEVYKNGCPKELDRTTSWSGILNKINAALPPAVDPIPARLRYVAGAIPAIIRAVNFIAPLVGCGQLEEPEAGATPPKMAEYMNEHLTPEQLRANRRYVAIENGSFNQLLREVAEHRPVTLFIATRQEIRPRFDHYVNYGCYVWGGLNQACPSNAPNSHYIVVNGFDRNRQHIFYKSSDGRQYTQSYEEVDAQWHWQLTPEDEQNPYLQAVLQVFDIKPGGMIIEQAVPRLPEVGHETERQLQRPVMEVPQLEPVSFQRH